MEANKIIKNIEDKVIKNEPISPVYYIEAALRVNFLIGDLDNILANYEGQMVNIEAELIKQEIPANKAKILAKNKINYIDYLLKKSEKERIIEFMRLAKKRAEIKEL